MEQSTQTNNHERVNNKVGRPKETGLFIDEVNKERARMRSRLYSSLDIEKEREINDYNIKQKKIMFIMIFFNFYLLSFHLNIWRTNYIKGNTNNLYSLAPAKSEEYML